MLISIDYPSSKSSTELPELPPLKTNSAPAFQLPK
jgi:hypothetical protein